MLVRLIVLVLLAAATARAEISVSFIAPELWGQPDQEIGLGGGLVEDFEDAWLAEGLTVEIADVDGTFQGTGWTSLPNIFDPVNGDPHGDAFVLGVWDGAHVLVNTRTNQSIYYGSPEWLPVAFYVPEGAAWIAIASQQVTVNHSLMVNGQAVGRLSGLGFQLGGGRNGVMIVSSDDPENPITSVSFGGMGDAFVIDHVVYAPAGSLAAEVTAWDAVKAMYRR
jgi:hypothetical protein